MSLLYSPALGVATSLRHLILSPALSGPLLLAITYKPEVVRNGIATINQLLGGSLSQDLSLPKTILSILFALSLIRQLNRLLNIAASNSWRLLASQGWAWEEELAVVTGGASGIGLGIVERLTQRGVRVAVFDIQEPKVGLGPLVRFYKCDVTSSESIAKASDAVRRDLGHPSILVNNAGITKPMDILQMPESFLRKIFGVNAMALWFTTQQFLPRMIQLNKGHVVTVASIASFVALPTGADYSATKAAALAFHESLTCELKHYYKSPNVLTTVVHPNFVATPLLDGFSDRLTRGGVKMLSSDDVSDQIVARIFSKRGGQLIIPDSVSLVSGIRGWPTWMQEIIRDLLGKTVGQE